MGNAQAFFDEMRYMMCRQMGAPNSPQWFNTGLHWAYGIDGPAQGHYYVDFKTGKLQWKRDDFGAGTILKIGPELLFLTYNGQLYRGIASPTEFKITGQAQVAPFGCRAYPAIANGRLYLRSSTWLFCLDLAKSAT